MSNAHTSDCMYVFLVSVKLSASMGSKSDIFEESGEKKVLV